MTTAEHGGMKICTFDSVTKMAGTREERTATSRRCLAQLKGTFIESKRRGIFAVCCQLYGIDVKVAVHGSGAAMMGDAGQRSCCTAHDCHVVEMKTKWHLSQDALLSKKAKLTSDLGAL